MNRRTLVILGVLVPAITVYAFLAPDARLFREPTLARILFYHVPSAFLATAFFCLAAYFGVRVLAKTTPRLAAGLHASAELGTIFASLTMATGILFSKFQWGAWWHNDPRQTSFLVVLLSYLALIALRGAFTDPAKRDRVTAAYAVCLLPPALFLTFVYPRLPQVEQQTFHPNSTIPEGQLDVYYSIGLWGTLAVLALVCRVVYLARVRLALLEHQLENQDELDQTDSRHTSPDGLVRPMALPQKDR